MAVEQLDAMKPGDVITVTDGPDNDRSFQGELLDVLVTDSPFVIVRYRHVPAGVMIDARRYTFKKMTTEAVAAVRGIGATATASA